MQPISPKQQKIIMTIIVPQVKISLIWRSSKCLRGFAKLAAKILILNNQVLYSQFRADGFKYLKPVI